MKRSAVVLTILVLAMLFGALYFYMRRSAVPAPSGSASSSDLSEEPGCVNCLTEKDNGRTLEITETTRITLELPAARYDESRIAINPDGILGQTFGATAAPGHWVRTYEAVLPGAADITAPSRIPGIPDYVLHINVAPAGG